ncbi:MAG: DNA methyltransferase, partial [Saprospiraceae bacterium]|nr:DNA methyltransferase [Saprospiraceae bacterium]
CQKRKNILVVQKILNSIVMDYYVSNTSISIQGGFPCYQKNFIEKFTIPIFTKSEIKILEKMTNKMEIDEFLIKKYRASISLPNIISTNINFIQRTK